MRKRNVCASTVGGGLVLCVWSLDTPVRFYRTLHSTSPYKNMLELPCIGFRYNDGPSVCMRDSGDGITDNAHTPHVSPPHEELPLCPYCTVHASRYQILSHIPLPIFLFLKPPFSWHPQSRYIPVRFIHGKSEPPNSAPLSTSCCRVVVQRRPNNHP